MELLKAIVVSKTFKTDENKEREVLKNISYMFPDKGMVFILGKSGSGKSTFLNMLAGLDKPSSGTILFNGEDINKWKSKRIEKYLNQDIGMVFQNYHLQENHTVLFNIMLPALIHGESTKNAEFAAISLLNSINFKEELFHQKCSNLSGGEKERVAILRALINNPKVLFADEPTGALDTSNSELVMETFKTISEKRLVIIVTHNLTLANEYGDIVLQMKDGHLEETVNRLEETYTEEELIEDKPKKESRWPIHLTKANLKRRFRRNLISIASMTIGLVSLMLITGFSIGNKKSVTNRSYKQLDYGCATLYKQVSQELPSSKISLVQMIRLNETELLSLDGYMSPFEVEHNYDALLSPASTIKCGDYKLEELMLAPIYCFKDGYIDRSLLLSGYFPTTDNLFEVVINKTARNYLLEQTKMDPVGLVLNVHSDYEVHYYTNENANPVITDYFIFDQAIRIVGVVDDFDFLSTPKAYYNYLALKELLQDTYLVNLSSYMDQPYSWFDYLSFVDGSDQVSSYSNRLFFKDINQIENLKGIVESLPEPYKIESTALIVTDTLLELMTAATMGMEIFLIIALIGTALIMGIISFSSYSEDKKTSAILTVLGASKSEIFSIYFYENLFIGSLSLLNSFTLSPFLSLIANKIITSLTGFEGMINIPLLRFMNKPFFFPLIVVISTLLICLISTYIPLLFSKKISPREELTEE